MEIHLLVVVPSSFPQWAVHLINSEALTVSVVIALLPKLVVPSNQDAVVVPAAHVVPLRPVLERRHRLGGHARACVAVEVRQHVIQQQPAVDVVWNMLRRLASAVCWCWPAVVDLGLEGLDDMFQLVYVLLRLLGGWRVLQQFHEEKRPVDDLRRRLPSAGALLRCSAAATTTSGLHALAIHLCSATELRCDDQAADELKVLGCGEIMAGRIGGGGYI
jgi:hypothetical protein